MLFHNLNATLLEHLPDEFAVAQRAVFYSDALFETIRVFDGEIPLFERHRERLLSGLTALGFHLPEGWGRGTLKSEILRTAHPNARVRLTVWRSPGGRYAPENDQPQFLITSEPLANNRFEWPVKETKIGVCQSVRLPIDHFSNLKTLNGSRYVAAAREARSNDLDDVLILNCHERICEATSSNVFWLESGQLCTVPLTEGCVAGVFRATVMVTMSEVVEKNITAEQLSNADEIFLTNAVRGIVPVRIFAGRLLPNRLTEQLFHTIQDALWPKNAKGNLPKS
ncbi:MAG: aminotransferase class IV [Saprospiraceae bacterium]